MWSRRSHSLFENGGTVPAVSENTASNMAMVVVSDMATLSNPSPLKPRHSLRRHQTCPVSAPYLLTVWSRKGGVWGVGGATGAWLRLHLKRPDAACRATWTRFAALVGLQRVAIRIDAAQLRIPVDCDAARHVCPHNYCD
jgi:hypothetical protein